MMSAECMAVQGGDVCRGPAVKRLSDGYNSVLLCPEHERQRHCGSVYDDQGRMWTWDGKCVRP